MVQVASLRSVTADVRFQYESKPRGMCGVQGFTNKFSPSSSTSIFSYHYHSTGAAFSFIGQESTASFKHTQGVFTFRYTDFPEFVFPILVYHY